MAILYIRLLIGPMTDLAQAKGWRWTFWLIAISVAAVLVPSIIIMAETYKPKIHHAKLKSLEQGNNEHKDNGKIIKSAIIRPLRFLLSSPIVLCLAFHSALVNGYLYIILTAITPVFESNYGFRQSTSGLVYLGIGQLYR